MSRIRVLKIALTLFALAICTGTVHAVTLVANPTAVTLACDTFAGPTAVNVGLTLATGATPQTVTVTAPGGSPLVLPNSAAVSSTTTATQFSLSVAAGCKGATNGQQITVTFTPNGSGTTPLTVVATLNITTSNGSALVAAPSAMTITCQKSGSTYTPGPSVTVNVTSAANLGTPFTVDNTTNVLPSWLSVTPLTGGTASSTAVVLTVVAKAGCGALPVGSASFGVHLLNAPAADKTFTVTIQVGGPSPLSASVSPVPVTYVKGTGTYTASNTNISASSAVFFSVDPTTLPAWLSATPSSGITTTPVTVGFAATAAAETLVIGSYSASVHLKVSGDLDYVLVVKLQVENPAATLSAAEGTTRNVNWTLGTALPSLVITPISSDSPIPFTVTTTHGTLYPQVSATSGLAYSFGSPLTVTFLQSVFAAAAPGTQLSGTVTLTPPSPGNPVNVTINVNVVAPGATISSASPSTLPTATSGSFTVAVSGAGFVVNSDAAIGTTVGIVNGGFIVPDTNIAATVLSSTAIAVVITVATNDPYLPFTGNGGTFTLGVCNPQGTSCNTPTGNVTITVGANPIIRAITNAASFVQATPPALPTAAPYDVLSIFGADFCVSGGTGCTGSNSILYGTLDPVTLRYLATLSPDAAGSGQRFTTVTFQTHGATPTVIATAPLLFVSNTQINMVVPDALKNYIGNTVDLVVSFGYGSGSTLLKSAAYSMTIAATDPGVFTTTGDGQGDVAALSPTNVLITQSAPANARSVAADSDIVQLYVTGLGRPDSDGTGSGYSATCMPADSYWAAVNGATGASPALTSDDGLVLQGSLFPTNAIQPCIKVANAPTVTVGGAAATVKYAGWVSGSIAGLYQINVQLASSSTSVTDESGTSGAISTTPLHLPVVVTMASKSSQASGADLWVVQSLLVTATGATSGTHNTAWAGTTIATADGATPITYSVTTGTLPAGLSLNASTGAITGTPTTQGTSTVVFTATDSSTTAVTGTVSVTFTIN